MSKFLGLGFPLEEVVAMATVNPAKVINRLPKLGTPQVGAPGDVAIMELVEEPVSFVAAVLVPRPRSENWGPGWCSASWPQPFRWLRPPAPKKFRA